VTREQAGASPAGEALVAERAPAPPTLEERALRLGVDSVQDYAIFLLTPDGHVQTWNRGAERIKGYAAPEIIGQHFSRFYPEDDIRAGKCDRELEEAARDGRVEDEGWRLRKDGTHFWAHVVLTAIRDGESGKMLGFVKVTQDLTQRLQAEEALKGLVERLQKSNQDLEEFAMVASHDLQEPLRKVQMFTDQLVSEYATKLDETARDYLDRMQKAARRGQGLIQGLLAFSRVTTRTQPPVTVALGDLAREVVQDLEPRLAESGGQVKIGDLPTLRADPLQMRQLLQNLIGNGLKFHRPGVPPIVELSAVRIDGGPRHPRWSLRVSDNGIGFDQKYLDRIFRIFQRLHGRGTYEGSGVGLAICRRIAERHGGRITATSQPGVGSTFIVELPQQQAKKELET
jgi:PAS domain S-box-containing protein